MADGFDPYRKWLGIPEDSRPPTHYQLLAIVPTEQDRDVIEMAVIRQSAFVRNYQKGPNSDAASQLLNEIAAAKACLLDPEKRAKYDAGLKPAQPAPTPAVAVLPAVATAIPVQPAMPPTATTQPIVATAVSVQPAVPTAVPVQPAAVPVQPAAPADLVTPAKRPAQRRAARRAPTSPPPSLADDLERLASAAYAADPLAARRAAKRKSAAGLGIPKPVLYGAAIGVVILLLLILLTGKSGSDAEPAKVVAKAESVKSPTGPKIAVEPKPISAPGMKKEKADPIEPKAGTKSDEESNVAPVAADVATNEDATRPPPLMLEIDKDMATPPAADGATLPSLEPAAETAQKPRLPVPAADELKQAADQVNEVFAQDLAQAKKPFEKQFLCYKLLDLAANESAPAQRYVLYEQASRLAIAGLAPALALLCDSEQAASFEVDHLPMAMKTIEELQSKELSKFARDQLLSGITALVDEALAAEQFEAGRRLARVGAQLATRQKATLLASQFKGRDDELALVEQQAPIANKARQQLAKNPQDAAANASLGKFLALQKGDWTAGLPHLAVGSDRLLRQLAEQDLAAPVGGEDLAKLGDAWWSRSESESPGPCRHLKARAAHWYSLALDGLSGLSRARIEKRLEQVDIESKEFGGEVDAGKPALKPIYLSDLKPNYLRLAKGTTLNTEPVVVGGIASPHGLFTHHDKTHSAQVSYRLNGQFEWFETCVAINDLGHQGNAHAVSFRIDGDGKQLWLAANKLKNRGDFEKVRVNVRGVRAITLWVDGPGSEPDVNAVWFEPRLIPTWSD
jgi:hypothetical protein